MHGQTHHPLTGRLSDRCVATIAAEFVVATQSWLLTKQGGVMDSRRYPLILEVSLYLGAPIYLQGVLGIDAGISCRQLRRCGDSSVMKLAAI